MSTHSIVHCLSPAAFGGLETVVQLLAEGQLARGHRVLIAPVVSRETHPFVLRMRDAGIPVAPIQITDRQYVGERRAVQRLLRDHGATIAHSHGYRPDIIDLAAARALGVPTVSTLHGFTGAGWKVRMYERLQLRSLRRADAVIAVSSGVAERAKRHGVAAGRLHLVQNGYAPPPADRILSRDTARERLGVPRDGIRAGWIGRFNPEKAPDMLIEGLATVREHDVPIDVSLLGDGPLMASVIARADALGVRERVQFHGAVPQGAMFLPAFDLLILSSRSEGTPMVLLEAMAARVPIVATRVGGIPQMLTDDEAYLVAPEDPAALARAIMAAAADPEGTSRKAAASRIRLERDFSVARWVDQHDAIYDQLRR